MYKDNLINNVHKDYRSDEWVNELYSSTGITLDQLQLVIDDLTNQYDFNTMTWAIPILEKMLKIKTNATNSIEDRRSFVEAKWKSSGKCDSQLIQAVCNSWKNGNVAVKFEDGIIKLTFNGEYGVPNDLETLIQAISEVKPEHLPLEYIFAYLLVKDVNAMTINQLQLTKINQLAGRR